MEIFFSMQSAAYFNMLGDDPGLNRISILMRELFSRNDYMSKFFKSD